jgi:hypothetical protein
MTILLAVGLLASTAALPVCSWDRPGQNPFMGNVVEAVNRYTDIPSSIRTKLKQKMASRKYDDIAEISKYHIKGKNTYTDLREMHFGPGTVCKTVTRSKWNPLSIERGLVYCEDLHCIIVPTVCRNVSRVTHKQEEDPLEFETAAGPVPQEPPKQEIFLPPLDFETAAGPGSIVPPITPPVINSFTTQIPNFPTYTPSSLLQYTTAVPEPKTWVLTLIGLSVIILSLRRK